MLIIKNMAVLDWILCNTCHNDTNVNVWKLLKKTIMYKNFTIK
jgi:hypothetical protein